MKTMHSVNNYHSRAILVLAILFINLILLMNGNNPVIVEDISNDENISPLALKEDFPSLSSDDSDLGAFISDINYDNSPKDENMESKPTDVDISQLDGMLWGELLKKLGIQTLNYGTYEVTQSPSTRIRYNPEEETITLIVGFKSTYSVSKKTIQDFFSNQDVITVNLHEPLNAIAITIPVSQLEDVFLLLSQIQAIKYVEPSQIYSVDFLPNDVYWTAQWGPQKIQADLAWDIQRGNPADVLVAVIDTGIDYRHPDLTYQYVPLGYDWVNQDTDPRDDHGHGTHCAGIIAATSNNGVGIAGIANVKVMAEKAIDSSGNGYDTDLADAIVHAVDQGADILSNSWGGPAYSSLVHDAMKYAAANDVVIVAAAGNDQSSTPNYPSALPEVISVSATDINDQLASFSSYGDMIEIAAPGEGIYSTVLITDGYYDSYDGTSMACPHVAGVAALTLSQFPDWSADRIRMHLRESVVDLGDPGWDPYFGFGRINASSAVQQFPSHNLNLVMDAPNAISFGETVLLNVTVYNSGFSDESAVNVSLYIDDTIVETNIYTEIASGTSVFLSYLWDPPASNTYNVTAYVKPVIAEVKVYDNKQSKNILVTSDFIGTLGGMYFSEDLLNYYITQGYLLQDIVSPFTLTDLNNYDYLFVSSYWTNRSSDELTAIDDYLQNGGVVVAMSTGLATFSEFGISQLLSDYGMLTSSDTFTVTFSADPTDAISGFHHLTSGASAITIPLFRSDLTVTAPAIPIIQVNHSDYDIVAAAVNAGSGFLCTLAGLFDTVIDLDDTAKIFENILSWSAATLPLHELVLDFSLEWDHYNRDSTIPLNVTVINYGTSEESFDLQFILNGSIQTNPVSSLASGTFTTVSYPWTPVLTGPYNITTYIAPIGSEFQKNNIATEHVYVSPTTNYSLYQAPFSWYDAYRNGDYNSTSYWYDSLVLPFPFYFYNQSFDVLYIHTAGWLSFDDTSEHEMGYPGELPSSSYRYLISPFANDFHVDHEYSNISVWSTADFVVIEYHNISYISIASVDGILERVAGTFEVVLYPNNSILFQYKEIIVDDGSAIGLNFGAHLDYCTKYPYDISGMTNFALFFTNETYQYHDLSVTLDAPTGIVTGSTMTINATLTNEGSYPESSVQFFILSDGNQKNSTIATLSPGESYTLEFTWNPLAGDEGLHNITAYCQVLAGEANTRNNKMTQFVKVGDPVLVFDIGDYIALNYSIYGIYDIPYINLTYEYYIDASRVNVTLKEVQGVDLLTGAPNSATTSWMIVNVVTGIVENATNWSSLSKPTYFGYQQPTNLKLGDTVFYESYTGNVTNSVWYDWNGVLLEAWEVLIPTGSDFWTQLFYGSHYILHFDKVTGVLLSHRSTFVGLPLELHLTNSSIIEITQPRELHLELLVPELIEPGETINITVFVQNYGDSPETDLGIQFIVDGSIIGTQTLTISSGEQGQVELEWTPSTEGLFNITAYLPVRAGEFYATNNNMTKFVEVANYKISWGFFNIFVKDNSTDNPISGAVIEVKNSYYSQIGYTDVNGYYNASRLDQGFYFLNVSTLYSISIEQPAFIDQIGDSLLITILVDPVISAPADFTIEAGDSSTLDFTLTAAIPGNYTLYLDDAVNKTDNWTSGTVITVILGNLPLGVHNFTLVVQDTSGTVFIRTVFVTVEDTVDPVITYTGPDSITFVVGSTGNTFTFNATDLYPGNFTLYQNGTGVFTDEWTSGVAITIDLDELSLSVGTYNFTLVVQDTSNNTASLTVTVTVTAKPVTTTTTTSSSLTTTTTKKPSSGWTASFVIVTLAGMAGILSRRRSKREK
ncbi:MAG: S8 family serine peptidase [Candidatus Odinarchaeota archaeon]